MIQKKWPAYSFGGNANDRALRVKLQEAELDFIEAMDARLRGKEAWNNRITAEVRGRDLTFDDLDKVSKFFGTKKINIGSSYRETGYCDTCRGTEVFTVLTIIDPTTNLEWVEEQE